MSTPSLTPAMKTARFLNIALNIVIGILILAFIAMLVLPFFGEALLAQMESQSGDAPSLPALNLSGGLGGSLIAAAYLFVAFVLKKIVKTTLEGNPFVEANISRLRKTWMVVALAEIIRMVAVGVIKSGTDTVGFDLSLTPWFLVFVIAIMAEVFRIGLELRRDQELTV